MKATPDESDCSMKDSTTPLAWSRRDFIQLSGAAAAGLAMGAAAATPDGSLAPLTPKVADRVPWKSRPFPLDRVRLLEGPFLQARDRDRRYLLALPNDRLAHCFRITAGLESHAEPLGGWETPTCEIRGHFSGGHYLSACALMYAATGDTAILDKANALVDALAQCQAKDGYLGAYPASFYDRLARGENVWVPLYTGHKILAGHLDMARHCGNRQALQTAARMADWLGAWMSGFDDEAWQRILKVEYGGIQESFLELHTLTGEEKYRRWGLRFEQPSLLDPLAAGRDELTGLHANTQIPKLVAAARAYEVTGEPRYRDIAERFWRIVTEHHTYCTGGTSDYEHWGKPDQFAGKLSGHSQECCCSYNMLKLTRHLHGWKPDAALMDYYERVLFNARLGTQDEAGMMMYFVPMDAGYWKVYNQPFDSFWCCTGTGAEEFAKTHDTIYFHDDEGVSVNLYIASELSWPEQGLRLEQRTRFPEEQGTALVLHLLRPRRFKLRLRIPYWANGANVRINGVAQTLPVEPGRYLTLDREFADGDRIDLALPMQLHAAPLQDESSIQAMMYGPLVLATRMGRDGMDTDKINVSDHRPSFNRIVGRQLPTVYFEPEQSWVRTTDQPLTFEALGIEGPLQLLPLYKIRNERYAIYNRVRAIWERNPQF